MKRTHDISNPEHSHKKHKRAHDHQHLAGSYGKHDDGAKEITRHEDRPSKQQTALDRLPPPTSTSAHVPCYIPFTISPGLPTLPPISSGPLSNAAFSHKSALRSYNRSSTTTDITYERLEFLGDAYIELIASRLIYERYNHLTAGQQSQLRELLVKNETLAEYSRSYGFDERIGAAAIAQMVEESKHRGNKGWNKILGDVFEAYVAAVILSDVEDGFAVAEKWLTGLWAPKLVEAAPHHHSSSSSSAAAATSLTHSESTDPVKVYNPEAKQELQKRILGKDVTLAYEKWKETVELKGDRLGQNAHFIVLYLTGWGYERKELGRGEGRNKVEAGNWAATQAMHGACRDIVRECEEKLRVVREQKKKEKEAREHAGAVEADPPLALAS